jgi:hypothetical protein
MKKEASLPVRLGSDEKQRLKMIAERMGLTTSALIRLLVRSFVDDYDRLGGRLALPPDWGETLDGDGVCLGRVAEKPGFRYGTGRGARK